MSELDGTDMIPGQKCGEERPASAITCITCDGVGRRPFNGAIPLLTYECGDCAGRGWVWPGPRIIPIRELEKIVAEPAPLLPAEPVNPDTSLVSMPVGTPNQYRYAKAHLRSALDNLILADHYLKGTQLSDLLYEAEHRVAALFNKATEKSIEDPKS